MTGGSRRRGGALVLLAGAVAAAVQLSQQFGRAFAPPPHRVLLRSAATLRGAPSAAAASALLPAATLGVGEAWALTFDQESGVLQDFKPRRGQENYIDFSKGGDGGEEIEATYQTFIDDERISQAFTTMVGTAFDTLGRGDVFGFFNVVTDYIAEVIDGLGASYDDSEFPWQTFGVIFLALVLFANTAAIVEPILSELWETPEQREKRQLDAVPPEVLERFNKLKEERKKKAEEEALAAMALVLPEGRAVRDIDKVSDEEKGNQQETKKQKVIKTTMLSGEVVEDKVWQVTGDPITTDQGKPDTWKSA